MKMSRCHWSEALLAGLSLLALPAGAVTGGIARDGAVTLLVPVFTWNAGSSYGQVSLAGTEPASSAKVLSRLAFWYRFNGVDTHEQRLPAPDTEAYNGADAFFDWSNLAGRGLELTIGARVLDLERPSGSLGVEVYLRNSSGNPLDLSLFAYLDPDASGTPADDLAQLRATGLIAFQDSVSGDPVRSLAAFGSPAWRVRAVGGAEDLMTALDDGALANLDNTGLPVTTPANLAVAYQWNVTMPGSVTSTFIPAELCLSSRQAQDVVKGDLNGDGGTDLVLQYPAQQSEQTWLLRHGARFAIYSRTTGGRGYRGTDRFSASRPWNEAVEQDATGQVFVSGVPIVGAPVLAGNWQLSATGDFNGDGLADLLWRNATSQKLVIWTMNGVQKTGNIIPSPDQAVDGNWGVVGAMDFNGDGHRDLLWYNASSGNLVVWTMDANVVRLSGFFTNPASAGGANWRPVAVGDYGRGGGPAGAPDIVWRNATSGKLVIWFMGLAGERKSGVFTTPDAPSDPLNAVVVGPR